jgi:hypothetical protein
MPEIQQSAETIFVRTRICEVAFRHTGDRWLHEISLQSARRWQSVLRSIEGTPDDDLPPSPALQDLRLEPLNDRHFEFQGMGQAGGVIYSAAIRFDVAEHALTFDMCIRGKRGDSALRPESAYEVADSWQREAEPVPEGGVRFTSSGKRLSVLPVTIEGQPLTTCQPATENGGLEFAAGCFGAGGSVGGSRPRSIRWSYRITLDGLP